MNKAAYYQGYLEKEAAPPSPKTTSRLAGRAGKLLKSFWSKPLPPGAPKKAPTIASRLLGDVNPQTFGPGRWAWEAGVPAGVSALYGAKEYQAQPEGDKDVFGAALSGLGVGAIVSPTARRYLKNKILKAPPKEGMENAIKALVGMGAVKIGAPAGLSILKDLARTTKNVRKTSEATSEVSGDVAKSLKDVMSNAADATESAKELYADANTRPIGVILEDALRELPKNIAEAAEPIMSKLPKDMAEAADPIIAKIPKNIADVAEPIVRRIPGDVAGAMASSMEESNKAIKDAIHAVKSAAGKAGKVAPYAAALALLGVAGYGYAKYKGQQDLVEQQAQQAQQATVDVYQRKYPYLSIKEIQQVATGQTKEWVMARRNKKRETLAKLQQSQGATA